MWVKAYDRSSMGRLFSLISWAQAEKQTSLSSSLTEDKLFSESMLSMKVLQLEASALCNDFSSNSEKAMAPHSSTLAWKIPWMEEPGRLQSMGSLRVGHDWVMRLHFHFSLSCIGEGNGNPLQYSCLENPRDGGAWWAAVYWVAQSRTRLKWLRSSQFKLSVLHSFKLVFYWCTLKFKPLGFLTGDWPLPSLQCKHPHYHPDFSTSFLGSWGYFFQTLQHIEKKIFTYYWVFQNVFSNSFVG